jgi:hypothetical protein
MTGIIVVHKFLTRLYKKGTLLATIIKTGHIIRDTRKYYSPFLNILYHLRAA